MKQFLHQSKSTKPEINHFDLYIDEKLCDRGKNLHEVSLSVHTWSFGYIFVRIVVRNITRVRTSFSLLVVVTVPIFHNTSYMCRLPGCRWVYLDLLRMSCYNSLFVELFLVYITLSSYPFWHKKLLTVLIWYSKSQNKCPPRHTFLFPPLLIVFEHFIINYPFFDG